MDGTALRTVRTRRRAVALAAVTAFALTATACSGGQSASTTTTKSRADMQREAAEKDGTLDLSLVNEGSDVSAAEAVDSMRVAAVGKTRTDAAATAPSAGGGSSSSGSSIGDVTPQAPRPTSSGSATPPAQTPVVPWSGIETKVVEVSQRPGTVEFKPRVCNTTTRQRTIVQNGTTVGFRIVNRDGASKDFPGGGGGPSTLSLAPSECRDLSPAAVWKGNAEPVGNPGTDHKVVVVWDASELGTTFSREFESGWFLLAP